MGILQHIDDQQNTARPLSGALPQALQQGEPVQFVLEHPRFLVTIDTEEAFDWDKPFSRTAHSTSHIPALESFQSICNLYGVAPVYLLDYPVLSDGAACEFFGGLVRAGDAYVGAHMHPWNTPPFSEKLSSFNSYGCNLLPEVEQAKLENVISTIDKQFGSIPLMFRAGRYGVGRHTLEKLAELGVKIDSSVRTFYDYRTEGGPDFTDAMSAPYWIKKGSLAELPLTSAYTGPLAGYSKQLFGADSTPSRLRGPMSRLRMIERMTLSPEGFSTIEAKRCIDSALKSNLPILIFSFHSSSIEPGNTSYVKTESDHTAFLQWWRDIYDYLAQKGVLAARLDDLTQEIITVG